MKCKAVLVISFVLTAILLSASACAIEFTDVAGREVSVENPQCVVSLYGSYGSVWQISGGVLAGTTSDALKDAASSEIQNLGAHTEPNMELLFSLNPDFVILSADVAEQADIGALLEDASIPCAYFSYQDWRGYMEMVELFTQITGRSDLYAEQVKNLEEPIQSMIAEANAVSDRPTALLLRAYSTNVRAKGSEGTVAGCILKDMGFITIADGDSPLSENLSMETILMADPDYIFVTTMGSSTEAALESLANLLTDNPAWATLTAVQEDHFFVLEKELFHQHPNDRWAESYAIIRDILLGE